ncbi:MET30 [Acrasis kona]|uniref:MET30 n=1 Tax=Acrasis kona TaxID=1008807 RepID=A0AAW2YLQ8_9EUKA
MGNTKSTHDITVQDEPRSFLYNQQFKILTDQQTPFILDESKNLKTVRIAVLGEVESAMSFIDKFALNRGQERFEHQLYKMAIITQMISDMSQLVKHANIDPHHKPAMLENVTGLNLHAKDKSFSRYSIARQIITQNDDKVLLAMHHLWNDIPEIKAAYTTHIDKIDSKSEEEGNLDAHILTPYLFNTVLLRFLTSQAQGIELIDSAITKEDVDMFNKYSSQPVYRPSGDARELQFIRNERRIIVTNHHSQSDATIVVVNLKQANFVAPSTQVLHSYLIINDYKTLCQEYNVPTSYAGRYCNYKRPRSLTLQQDSDVKSVVAHDASIRNNSRITSADFDRLLARQSSILPDVNYGITMDFTLALPVNVIVHISSYLDVKDLCNINQVNSVMYQACDHDDIWKKLVLDKVIVDSSLVDEWYQKSEKQFGVWKSFYTNGMQVALLESKLDSLCDAYLDQANASDQVRHQFKQNHCMVSSWDDEVYSHRLFETLLDRLIVNLNE